MSIHANTIENQNRKSISAPVLRTSVQSTLSYTPTESITVMLGGNVEITPAGGVAVSCLHGQCFILVKDVTYAFSVDTPLGIS